MELTKKTAENPEFKKLDYEGLKTLVQWAAREGWNPGIQDAAVFWATDPDGYYGYYQEGELIAGGSIVSYDGRFGFMGFFIVAPPYRTLGLGRRLWYQRRNTLIQRLNAGASIGMDGVVAMQPFYAEGGFHLAFRDERYERSGENFTLDPHISSFNIQEINEIYPLDMECFGFPRAVFLQRWLTMPNAKTFQYTDNKGLRGFAVSRQAISGYKIGPLFADNASIAEALYRACLNSAPGESFYLDIPVIHQAAYELVKKYRARYVFECARMYLGSPPALAINKVFGITTFELG